jgi:hypothetical protein
VAWTVVFTVVLAAVIFIRMPFKRALQRKMNATADYMFWTRWGDSPQQYKGETTSAVKTQTKQGVSTVQSEKDSYINNNATSTVSEDSASVGVEEGSQPALKTFDLNTILP